MNSIIRFGTRSSLLARWQSEHVKDLLSREFPDQRFEIEILTSRGDKILDTPLPLIGGKGLFTSELEEYLKSRKIDLAVHSLKDLPTDLSNDLTIGAIPKRGNPKDVLISRNRYTLDSLPNKARIGTTSPRRAAQVLRWRADLQMENIRGNVETRLKKALDPEGIFDGIILAYAGLDRLARLDAISQVFSFDQMLPAPGQGAVCVQCREENDLVEMLNRINDSAAELSVTAERAFLAGLGGGCSVPIAALGVFDKGKICLRGRVTARDGSKQIDVSETTSVQSVDGAYELGIRLAEKARTLGAIEILK